MSLCAFRLLVFFALVAASLPLAAQETIVYSKPSDAKEEKTDDSINDKERKINSGDYNAPRQVFNDFSPNLPGPRPSYFGNMDPAVRDALNKRKNWTLLTPEQILGVQTPEDILGIKDQSTEKLSLEDQYLLRISTTGTGATTDQKSGNATRRDDNNSRLDARNSSGNNNPFDRYKNDNPLFSPNQMANPQIQDQSKDIGQFFNSPAADQQQGDSIWTSKFAQPSQPKISPEQTARMDRFRAMLELAPAPDRTASQVRYPTTPSTSTKPDSFFEKQPQFNPRGGSASLLEDNSTRPVGIQPLPGITGPRLKPETKRPDWQAQLPPWMKEGPQQR